MLEAKTAIFRYKVEGETQYRELKIQYRVQNGEFAISGPEGMLNDLFLLLNTTKFSEGKIEVVDGMQ